MVLNQKVTDVSIFYCIKMAGVIRDYLDVEPEIVAHLNVVDGVTQAISKIDSKTKDICI